MRTPEQGQAAVAGEREDRRRSLLSAWRGALGRGRTSRGLSLYVERYPEALLPRCSAERGRPVLPWARFAFMAFLLREGAGGEGRVC